MTASAADILAWNEIKLSVTIDQCEKSGGVVFNQCCYQVELYDYCEKKGHNRYNGYCYTVESLTFKNEADCDNKGGVAYNNGCYSIKRLPDDYLKDFDCAGIDGIWYRN